MRARSRPVTLPLVGAAVIILGILADRFGIEASWPLIWIGLALVIAGSFLEP